MLGPHKRSISGAKQKLGVDERTQERVARRPIETPQPLRLRCRQAKSGHLDVFPLNPPKDIVKRLLCCHVRYSHSEPKKVRAAD
jgi:hypothetical protein